MRRVTSAAMRRAGARGNASEGAAKATTEKIEEVVERAVPTQKPCPLPNDGTPVFRKGVPVRGSLGRLPLKEKLVICLVFSITGTSAVLFVRPTLKYLVDYGFFGLPQDSGFKNGPWLYRLLYFAVMWPTYSLLLYCIGGIFGRRIWFSNMLVKMWGRILPKRATAYLRYMLDTQ